MMRREIAGAAGATGAAGAARAAPGAAARDRAASFAAAASTSSCSNAPDTARLLSVSGAWMVLGPTAARARAGVPPSSFGRSATAVSFAAALAVSAAALSAARRAASVAPSTWLAWRLA